jgi:DNA gyrase subunit A
LEQDFLGRDRWGNRKSRRSQTEQKYHFCQYHCCEVHGMPIERPDLSRLDPETRAYIESLENELETLRKSRPVRRSAPASEDGDDPEMDLPPLVTDEPPTTLNLITLTASGNAKRTPRHLYQRQRRGGMGVFDLDTPQDEPPAVLVIADEKQSLLLFTNLARAFRVPVNTLPEGPVHSRGQSILGRLNLHPDEHLVSALPDLVKGSVAMVSRNGNVRTLRHHVFGEYMKPGTVMFDVKAFGPLVSACWTPGDGELFIATRSGRAIRFSEKLVPPQGGPGIKVEGEDYPAAITAVYPDSGVLLIGGDGKGTIRLMEGFAPNKSPGGSGKNAMNTSNLVGAAAVADENDVFLISRLSKIIRFRAMEIPPKEGVVQGVHCMALRADSVAAVTTTALSDGD